ncbi:DUF4097 family beta strand repeat-containing protein [Dokdonella sp. MW10]|uniref:DUF4097 family beta strand repeat-containing protein n=1 Tax=Dokdonella sp. MW10 TaxID=2992926 RepID=UPI003F7EE31D
MRRLVLVPLLFCATLAAADDCPHSARRDFDVDAAGLRALTVALGSTDLQLRGVAGLARVEVRGKACASDASLLERLQVTQRRDGDRLVIEAERDTKSSWSLFGSQKAYIDLEIRVPAALAATVETGSGDVVARDLASLDYRAGSGDLEASDIAGELVAKVGSGDIEADGVGRFTLVSTGSGDAKVRGVRGDVEARRGGSGDLDFERVDGDVRIGDIGSGDVTLRDIGRNVTVESIGSGDISASDVRGDLVVRSQGSGDTTHRNVGGKVDIPRRD